MQHYQAKSNTGFVQRIRRESLAVTPSNSHIARDRVRMSHRLQQRGSTRGACRGAQADHRVCASHFFFTRALPRTIARGREMRVAGISIQPCGEVRHLLLEQLNPPVKGDNDQVARGDLSLNLRYALVFGIHDRRRSRRAPDVDLFRIFSFYNLLKSHGFQKA